MTFPALLALALTAATTSPALAARCEPPAQRVAADAPSPRFICPSNPQIAPALLHAEVKP